MNLSKAAISSVQGESNLLRHDLDCFFWPAALAGVVQDTRLIGLGGGFWVNIGRPQVFCPGTGAGSVAHRYAEHIAQVGCRVGGQKQGFVSLPCQPDCSNARGDGLTDPALTGKE